MNILFLSDIFSKTTIDSPMQFNFTSSAIQQMEILEMKSTIRTGPLKEKLDSTLLPADSV